MGGEAGRAGGLFCATGAGPCRAQKAPRQPKEAGPGGEGARGPGRVCPNRVGEVSRQSRAPS